MAILTLEGGPIAVLTLDRPPANAINRDFFIELAALQSRLAAPEVRAVVLTGTGRFFSAGLDLFEVFAYDPETAADFARRFDCGLTDFFALPKPVVAAVNGHAIAGGALLAALADFRMMADGDGRVGLTETPAGLPFPSVALELARFACAGRHLPEILYLGRTYPPAEACSRGFIDMVVPAIELRASALALAEELAALPPLSFSSTKVALRADTLQRLRAICEQGDPVWDLWRRPETRAALEAFRARTLRKKQRPE